MCSVHCFGMRNELQIKIYPLFCISTQLSVQISLIIHLWSNLL